MSGGGVEAVADAIDRVGKNGRLRRLGGQKRIWFDVTVKAVDRGYQPNELAGGIVQGDREVKISNREILTRHWPGPPRRGDQIILDGRTYTIQGVDSPSIGEETAMHVMQVRGAS